MLGSIPFQFCDKANGRTIRHALSSFRNTPRYFLFVVVFLSAACEPNLAPRPTDASPTQLTSAWGVPTAVTWAPVSDMPALAAAGNSALLGAFELLNNKPTLVVYKDGVRSPSNVTSYSPHDLRLFSATENGSLAVWMDDDASGIQRLYAARLNDVAFSDRGPIEVSSGAVTRYAAAALPDNSYWMVWSTPVTGESALIGSRLDSQGRPRSAELLRSAADYPALAVTNAGNALLFWLETSRLDLFRGEVTDLGLTRINEVYREPWTRVISDQLMWLEVGIDLDYAYVFWQVRNGLGLSEVWVLSVPLDSAATNPAARLTISRSASTVQTSFNHGVAYAATSDSHGLATSWAQPAPEQNDTLPVAVMQSDSLCVTYFRDGRLIGIQTLAKLEQPLIAPPRIAITTERDLIVAWWQPDTLQEAVLFNVSSHP